MSDRSLLPFVASSLNDVYSKLDGISNQLKHFEDQLIEFLSEFNEQIIESLQKIGKIHDILLDVGTSEKYELTTKLLYSTLEQINESRWYIDFLTALRRILNVVQDIET